MTQPAPVNLESLKGILAKSKAVMNKISGEEPKQTSSRQLSEDYSDNYSKSPSYDERDEREPNYDEKPQVTPSMEPKMYTDEQVMNSKLPQAIKEAMMKSPIPMLQGPPSNFTLDDVSDLVDKPKSAPLRESRRESNSEMITVSKKELQEMIKEGIGQYFKDGYEKRITETAIKKTINVLIKEGKLNTKPKTK
jgi:hypothetical protein